MAPKTLLGRGLASLALILALGLAACFSRWGVPVNNTPPHCWWDERGPVVPHESFPSDCKLCHEGDDWYTIRDDFEFDHLEETGVGLVGAHERAECLRCHNDRGPVTLYSQQGCRGCHEDVHLGQLGTECATCHDERNWRPNDIVAEHNRTRFPLVGAHAAAACWRCHPGSEVGNFTRVDVECLTCHMEDLARATNPDHQASGFTDDCDRCHIPTTWTGAGFSHPGFALTGRHRTIACSDCHAGGVFTALTADCFGCHQDNYNLAPDHVTNNYAIECQGCHNTTAWTPANFNHAGITAGCDSCHLDNFQATTDPDHQAEGFPTTCEACHNSSAWTPAGFSHEGITAGCEE